MVRIFVINLKRSAERRRNIESQLAALGLPFEISEGVDALNFSREEYGIYQETLQEGIHSLPPGLFGSSWAHIKVYEKIVDQQIPVALILEDDIRISSDLVRILGEDWIGRPFWEFVHLGYPSASFGQWRQWFLVSWRRTKANPRFGLYFALKAPVVSALYLFEIAREFVRKRLRPGPVRFARPLYLGDGYLLTLEGARKLLSIAYPIRYTGDRLFNQARVKAGLKFYGYCPPVVVPNDDYPSETGYTLDEYEAGRKKRAA